MAVLRRIHRYLHNPSDFLDASGKHLNLLYLTARNRCCSLAVTRAGAPVVSLTTHGRRILTAHFAIESIARGSLLPSRFILWIDDAAAYQNLPRELLRLQRRGLEIRLCRNYGPHKKYFPYVEHESSFHVPLVTADDDILYPRSWLENLQEAFQKSPGTINCNFARRVQLDSRGITRFVDWPLCETTEPSFCHHAIGMSGVIYPPAFLANLKRAGSAFLECCPKADDLWLHVQAVRAGYRIRQISSRPARFLEIPGTGSDGLCKENLEAGGNDKQVSSTYTATDIDILRQDLIAA